MLGPGEVYTFYVSLLDLPIVPPRTRELLKV